MLSLLDTEAFMNCLSLIGKRPTDFSRIPQQFSVYTGLRATNFKSACAEQRRFFIITVAAGLSTSLSSNCSSGRWLSCQFMSPSVAQLPFVYTVDKFGGASNTVNL
jgi:hypothetical protein